MNEDLTPTLFTICMIAAIGILVFILIIINTAPL